MPDLFRKPHHQDPGAAAPAPDVAAMTLGGGGGRRRGKKAKTGVSAMLLGVNTMYDTSSSDGDEDDDE